MRYKFTITGEKVKIRSKVAHLKEIAIIARYKNAIMRNKGDVTINSYIEKYEVIL